MAKSSKKYWFDRIAAERQALAAVGDMIAREKAVCARQSAAFDAALAEINAELEALRKDVGDAELNRAMMQKPLTPKQLEDWSKRQEKRLDNLIEEYGEKEGRRIYGTENAKTAKRDRANRIVRRGTALKQSIETIASGAAAKAEKITADALRAEAQNGANAFKKQFKGKTEVKFNTVSPQELDQIAKTEWRGGNYSERIWADRDAMVKDLERAVNLGVTNGWSIPRMKKEVERHVQSGKQSAERIARTEMNRVSNAAEMAQYEANGIHYYRFIATEDARTCEICGQLHDKVIAVADAVVGENFPPVHPNCRCRTVGSFVDDKGKDDDKWLDDLIDEAEEEVDHEDAESEATGDDGAGDNDKEAPAPISHEAYKPSLEVQKKIDKIEQMVKVQNAVRKGEPVIGYKKLRDDNRTLPPSVVNLTAPHTTAMSIAQKLVAYCLNFDHESGKSKARVFKSALGVTIEEPQKLVKLLVFDYDKATPKGEPGKLGQRYEMIVKVQTNEGELVDLITVWNYTSDGVLRLVTAYLDV